MKKVSELKAIYGKNNVVIWCEIPPTGRPKNVVKVSCYYGTGSTNCVDQLAMKG